MKHKWGEISFETAAAQSAGNVANTCRKDTLSLHTF